MLNLGRKREDEFAEELEYRKAIRNMQNEEAGIRKKIADNRHRVCSAESSGNHAAAVGYARIVRMLTGTAEKMGMMRDRLEMLHTLCGVGNMMQEFTAVCSGLSRSLNGKSSVTTMADAGGALAKADVELQGIFDRLNAAGMCDEEDSGCAYCDPEDEQTLKEILKEQSRVGSRRILDMTGAGLDKAGQKN